MKYGLNLLLWTSDVNEEVFPLLDQIKGWGYDGVELPVFEMNEANFKAVGQKLKDTGLETTAVTVCTPEENPISPDAALRQAGVDRLKQAIDMCAAAGANAPVRSHTLGPRRIHRTGPHRRRMELGQGLTAPGGRPCESGRRRADAGIPEPILSATSSTVRRTRPAFAGRLTTPT